MTIYSLSLGWWLQVREAYDFKSEEYIKKKKKKKAERNNKPNEHKVNSRTYGIGVKRFDNLIKLLDAAILFLVTTSSKLITR